MLDTRYVDRSVSAETHYVYRVKARNTTGLNPWSSYANAETATAPAAHTHDVVPKSDAAADFPGGGTPPMPTTVTVDTVPIVVDSTTDDYFVLYVSHEIDKDTTVEVPVAVTRGEAGTTTLAENVEALPAERYKVEKYLVASPADVDGDCVDDLTELANLGNKNPLNAADTIESTNGVVAIPDKETFDLLAFNNQVKFVLFGWETDSPRLYFVNSKTHPQHEKFFGAVDFSHSQDGLMTGYIFYHPEFVAADGTKGVYRYSFYTHSSPFNRVDLYYTLFAANAPVIGNNLAYFVRTLPAYEQEFALYEDSRIDLIFPDAFSKEFFVSLNTGVGYGLLRRMDLSERPNPRDIVIYETLPNDLPRVAGIISFEPQTPLSHVNLRAVQDGVPNAYINSVRQRRKVLDLIGSYVRYEVTETSHSLSATTKAEVDAHYASSRPSATQTPQRDLSVTTIEPLSQVGFNDWDAFGVKAANVAVLGTLGFPEGTVPDGFAIPFHFYDEFMKANNLYDDVREMLADEDFQNDFNEQEDELEKLREKIKNANTPPWIIDALTTMHGTYPEGQSLRYRSSTNNEDLPGFNGAGLYDSKTQDRKETEEDGIDKSIKGVWASLWNFRAFVERDFHRVDHLSTAMGVLVHPNYTDELANGVAVSFDPIYGGSGRYYANTQVGEDLVTNPGAHSVPEEILLKENGKYTVLATSNLVRPGQLLMSADQMEQLRQHLSAIHSHFEGLYNPVASDFFAMEIEFKITSENKLAIKQARPWVFDTKPDPTPTPGTDGPTITNTRNPSPYRENGTGAVHTFRAGDPQGRPVSWEVTGTDSHAFEISSSGVLTFVNPPDFENPTNTNRDNKYDITVVVTDQQGLTDRVDVTVTVTNHAEGVEPTITTRRPPTTYRENGTSPVYTFRASDPQRQIIAWSLEGTDRGDFTITRDSSGKGMLTFSTPPDFEDSVDADRQNDYELAVIATDEDSHTDRLSFTITVTDVNEGPEISRLGNPRGSVPENHDQMQVLARYTATDPEGGTVSRWRTSGTDGGDFVINEQGELRFRNTPDYERPADSNRDNTYVFTVQVSDGGVYGSFEETVTVTPLNEPPAITTTSRTAFTQPENRTSTLYTFRAIDPERATITWSVVGTDGRFFTINERGEFSFRETSSPNHEIPGDVGGDNIYDVMVQARDDDFNTSTLDVTVTVTEVNEGPEVTGGGDSFTVRENQDWSGASFTASDPEAGTVTRWALGGRDGRSFTITDAGLMTFRTIPDFERPADSNRDNVYEVRVRPYDGRYYGSHDVTVRAEDVNEISGPSTLARSENFEGLLARYSATGRGDLTVVPTWRLTGTDSGDFNINERGELTFRSTPDHERPADSNRDNVYIFVVQASDDRYYGTLDVTVTVTPVNEPPTITTTSSSATGLRQPENRTSRLYTYRATDPEGSPVTWSVGGTDGRFFAIDERGQFFFSETSPPDFEARMALGQENVYDVTVQVRDDGSNTASLPVTVTVTDVNEGPEVSGPSSFTIAENQGLPNAVYTATDPEGANVARWNVGGRDGGDFFITQGGTLYFRYPPDYERPADSNRNNVYEVTVQPSDGRNSGSYPVTVTVNDVNEPPEFNRGSRTSFTQPENRVSTLYTFRAKDPEQGTISWTVAGTDSRFLTIDERGQVSFNENNPPDFDTPVDDGRNNLYNVTIQARDPESNSASLPVTVTVTEVNEGPEVSRVGNAPAPVPENQDPDRDIGQIQCHGSGETQRPGCHLEHLGQGRRRLRHKRLGRIEVPQLTGPRAAGRLRPEQRVRGDHKGFGREKLRHL